MPVLWPVNPISTGPRRKLLSDRSSYPVFCSTVIIAIVIIIIIIIIRV